LAEQAQTKEDAMPNLNEILADPLRFYTLATAIAVVVISTLLALVRLPGVWVPIRTWLIMLPVVLGALWLGRPVWVLLVTLVSIVAFTEFARVTRLREEPLLVAVVCGAIVAENLFAFLGTYNFFMATPMWAILALTLVPIVRNRTERMLQNVMLAGGGIIFFGYFLAHLSYLERSPLGLGYLLYVLLATQLNDAFGFIFGKLFGRHKWTSISPNKTIEGAVLAATATLLLALAQWKIAMPNVPLWGVIAAGLIVGIGGQVGDLTMANVKRNVGVKDFGTVLPGHGGLTDRVNSLMITVPMFAHFMGFLFGGFA
jgi:phosphatidate cytidylyltransferase